MLHYFLSAFAISIATLCLLASLSSAPARFKLYLCLLGIGAWLIPWPFASAFFSSFMVDQSAQIIERLSPAVSQNINNLSDISKVIDQESNHLTLLLLLPLFGALYFFVESYRQYRSVKEWYLQSSLKNELWQELGFAGNLPELRIISNFDNAFTSGIRKPVIWIGEKFLSSAYIRSILKHELEHTRRYDNAFLLTLTFLKRLFWWNPMVWVLVTLASRFIELSCDEACMSEDKDYQNTLAEVILVSRRSTQSPLHSSFIGFESLNLARIKHLNKEHKMKISHGLSFVIIALLSMTVIAAPSITKANKLNTATKIYIHFEDDNNNVGDNEWEIAGAKIIIESLREYAHAHNLKFEENFSTDNSLRISAKNKTEFDTLAILIEAGLGESGFSNEMTNELPKDTPFLLHIQYDTNEDQALDSKLLVTSGIWTGLSDNGVNIRLKPTIKGDRVFIESDIVIDDGTIKRVQSSEFIAKLNEPVWFRMAEQLESGKIWKVNLGITVSQVADKLSLN